MNPKEVSEIIDGVYFQKLSLMLGNIQNWQKKKEDVLSQLYGYHIQNEQERLQKSQKEIKNQLLQFLKILNQQYSFLAKLKKQEKEVEISSGFPLFKQFSQKFTNIKHTMLELCQYLGKFIGVTNYEYTEIRKVHDEVGQIKSRYDYQKSKFSHNYNLKKELIYSKKHMKKHFELSKYLELLSLLERQRKIHEQTYLRIHNALIRDLDIRVRMYKNITDNLEYISELFEKCFKENSLLEISQFFKEKYAKSIEDRRIFKQNEEEMVINEEPYKELKKQFYTLFDSFLVEITVANWNISFQNKEELPQRPENVIKGQMSLTFDNKILFYKADTNQIMFEQIFEDTKISEPESNGKVQIKDKKSKLKYLVEFQKSEQEDAFYLHLEKMNIEK